MNETIQECGKLWFLWRTSNDTVFWQHMVMLEGVYDSLRDAVSSTRYRINHSPYLNNEFIIVEV